MVCLHDCRAISMDKIMLISYSKNSLLISFIQISDDIAKFDRVEKGHIFVVEFDQIGFSSQFMRSSGFSHFNWSKIDKCCIKLDINHTFDDQQPLNIC